MDIDKIRKIYLAIAEASDALRIAPRLLVGGYALMLWQVVKWYMTLPTPSTQHAALVTAVIGIAAAVFGLYTSTGRKWGEHSFKPWSKKETKPTE